MSSTILEAPAAAPNVTTAADAEVILSVRAVSKHYKLWTSPSERLRYSMLSQAHRTLRTLLPPDSAPLAALRRRRDALHQDFTALQDVSFEVRRGESLGIIGRNGAGKSTLLQIIAGTLRPTSGQVEVYGRIAALLELGSGLNLEFTGRENVYLNASLLGLTKREVDDRFDEIASFADIGQFLDQPVKAYSSGMMLRLAFAVQMAVRPAVFIIDEALAVGDIYFQNKCNKLLRRRLDEGLTLLLVSHSPAAVRALCQRGLVLNRGTPVFLGPSDEAVNVYHALGDQRRGDSAPTDLLAAVWNSEEGAEDDADPAGHVQSSDAPAKEAAPAIPQGLGQVQDEVGSREALITGCELFDARGRPCHEFSPGEPVRVGFTVRSQVELDEVIFGFAIRDKFNNVVSACTSLNRGVRIAPLRPHQLRTVYLTLAGRLGSGEYLLDLGVGTLPDVAGSPTSSFHRVGGITHFGVSWGPRDVSFQGICDLEAHFEGEGLTQDPGTS